ncbi:MAG: hypothetical protein JWO70_147 [Betaproteobacteria bacterium]|nr:hypothetical protein [Betaproteobacteria bacterium]
MHTTIREFVAASGLAAAIAVSPVWAQAPTATRLIGTIERIDGATLVVKTAVSERQVSVAANTPVFGLVKASLADVKPGVFVGVGATPQPDGSQRAIRVIIFTESMRGLGEGHRPWDRPGTTMTNATVDTAVSAVAGQVVTVKYKGGEKNIVIGPDAAIMTYVVGDKSELRRGANVVITGTVKDGGAFEASRIVVGRGGITPT